MAAYRSVPYRADTLDGIDTMQYNPYTHNSSDSRSKVTEPPIEKRRVQYNDGYVPPSPEGAHLSYHPFSTIILVLWAAIIVLGVLLLEKSAAAAPRHVSQPWYYRWLPGIFLTVFAQAHGAITAMHLARLAVSGLQSSSSAPASWMELLWLADKSWADPVGILSTLLATARLRTRVSGAFALFAALSLVALATPIVLSRAYPVEGLVVQESRTFRPNALDEQKLEGIDAYAQMAAGGGAWATNLTVAEVFNNTVFIPPGTDRSGALDDVFFGADVQGMSATLPGLRIQGGCAPISVAQGTDLSDAFDQACNTSLSSIGEKISATLASASLSLNASYCTDGGWESFITNGTSATNSAFVWFQNTNITGMLGSGPLVQGIVQCNATISTGHASLNGSTLTFDNFTQAVLYNASAAQGGEPLLHPLYAALHSLIPPGDDSGEQAQAETIDMLGYAEVNVQGELIYIQPSLDQLAGSVWQGVSQMTAAMSLLGRTSNATYPATAYIPVSGRTRDPDFVLAAAALLGIWAVGLVCGTAWMYRPTFGDSLNSYTAARLLADKPELVQGYCSGMPDQNPLLLQPFERVGDDEVGAAVGHITPGGRARLTSGRRYGVKSSISTY